MDQYEDLQKFIEKTQMKSIRFVDFTKQNKEVNHGQWTIVQQLAGNNAPPVNNISPDQPSQVLNTTVTDKAPDPVHLAPLTTRVAPTTNTMSLLKDVGMQLNRPETFQTEVLSLSPIMTDIQAQFQPLPTDPAQPSFQPQPAVQAQPVAPSQTNFSHLFTAPVVEAPVLEKEAPLQSLLKRIATCR